MEMWTGQVISPEFSKTINEINLIAFPCWFAEIGNNKDKMKKRNCNIKLSNRVMAFTQVSYSLSVDSYFRQFFFLAQEYFLSSENRHLLVLYSDFSRGKWRSLKYGPHQSSMHAEAQHPSTRTAGGEALFGISQYLTVLTVHSPWSWLCCVQRHVSFYFLGFH